MLHFLRFFLLPFSWLYGLVIWLRNIAYNQGWFKTHHLNVPILSVGNLSVGGTGKTPMAEYLMAWLQSQGLEVAYLSRGYGRKTKGYVRVLPDNHTASQVGDEALQVARKFPQRLVAVCENRVLGATNLLKEARLDCIILDDAFQHRRLGRTVDLVLLDANRPPWRDYLLPVGRLREPESSLKRAHLVVVNKISQRMHIPRWQNQIEQPACFAQLAPSRLVSFSGGPSLTPSEMKHVYCIAFSALGNNQAFFTDLRRLGMKPHRTFAFPDHQFFKARQIKAITGSFRKLDRVEYLRYQPLIVTTEKDYIRLKDEPWFKVQFGQFPFYYLEVKLDFLEGEALLQSNLRVTLNLPDTLQHAIDHRAEL